MPIASARAALRTALEAKATGSHAPSSALGKQLRALELRVGTLADKTARRVTSKTPARDDGGSVVAQPSSSAGLTPSSKLDRIRASLVQVGASLGVVDKLIHAARQDGFDLEETIRKAKAAAASRDSREKKKLQHVAFLPSRPVYVWCHLCTTRRFDHPAPRRPRVVLRPSASSPPSFFSRVFATTARAPHRGTGCLAIFVV
eukprot:3272418-Prymnesium_polylepis.1